MVYNSCMPAGRPAKTERSGFALRIQKIREATGMSQREVASMLGISQPAYVNWERKDIALTLAQLQRLAEVFGVKIEALFEDRELSSNAIAPTGKLRRLVNDVRELPKTQQQRVIATLEDALIAQKAKVAS